MADNGSCMRLKDLREDSDITQKAIAEFLHVKQNTYSQYENGQRQIPIEMLVALARYYGTSTDYILELTDIKPHILKNKNTHQAEFSAMMCVSFC